MLVSNCWQEKTVQLNFLWGELRLGTLRLRGLVLTHGLHPQDVVSVPELPASVDVAVIRSHYLSGSFPQYSSTAGAFRYIPDRYYRYYVDLRQTLPHYLAKFSSKSRYTLLKKVRRFKKLSDGKIDVREFSRPGQIDEFHALACQISAKTYQERLLAAGMPDDPGFVAEMRRMSEAGAVRAYVLFLQGRPIAYMYCAAMEGNDLMYRFVGYDPEHSHISPGVVLHYLALERLFAEQRFDSLDFGEGSGTHKQFFSTGSLACADLYYFRDTARHRAIAALHAMLRLSSRTVAGLLQALGLKPRLKKLLREGTTSMVRSAAKKAPVLAERHPKADADHPAEPVQAGWREKIG